MSFDSFYNILLLCLFCGHLLLLFKFISTFYISLKSQLILLVWFPVLFPLPFFTCCINARPLISVRQSCIRIRPQIWPSYDGARCRRGDRRGRYVYLVLVTVVRLSGT